MRKPYCCYGLILLFCTILTSCIPGPTPQPQPISPSRTEGWAPVYGDMKDAMQVKSLPPREIVKGGKIYIKSDTLYQVENGKGIHVIHITRTQLPQKIRFIEITGCQEMAIMNHYLYTNNMNDLVVININDMNNVSEVDRVSNTFHLLDQTRPPGTGWYECPDPSKGAVIGWEIKELSYPKCSR